MANQAEEQQILDAKINYRKGYVSALSDVRRAYEDFAYEHRVTMDTALLLKIRDLERKI